MSVLANRITAELAVLVGQPIGDCWRVSPIQIFEFGPRSRFLNRKGEETEVGEFEIHLQCRWRMVDPSKFLFGSDDAYYPADEDISILDFDSNIHESILRVAQRTWSAQWRDTLVHVVRVRGDAYGGFRIELERGFALEAFPCHLCRGEHSEHWRLLGHRQDGSHFVVTGYGVEGEDHQPAGDS
jgi:hypothetical protein